MTGGVEGNAEQQRVGELVEWNVDLISDLSQHRVVDLIDYSRLGEE